MKDHHFGFDGVPVRFASGWTTLLSQCPARVDLYVWEAAIYDGADFFGWWGPNLIGFAGPPTTSSIFLTTDSVAASRGLSAAIQW